MAFEPAGVNHAIVEVVFGIFFAKPFLPDALETLFGAHDKFKARLPGANRINTLPIAIGGQSIAVPGAGIAFDRHNTAGGLEQRLRVEGNSVFVNSLVYSRWNEVSADAHEIITDCLSVLNQAENSIAGVLLQYVDAFAWNASEDTYDLHRLLANNGAYFPASPFGRGPFWHLHQGWFRYDGLPVAGKMLERITTDGVVNDKGRPTVRMDCFLGLDFLEPLSWSGFLEGAPPTISYNTVFNFLHDRNKEIVRGCLTDEMAQRIGIAL